MHLVWGSAALGVNHSDRKRVAELRKIYVPVTESPGPRWTPSDVFRRSGRLHLATLSAVAAWEQVNQILRLSRPWWSGTSTPPIRIERPTTARAD
jgi:hypothetical protein